MCRQPHSEIAISGDLSSSCWVGAEILKSTPTKSPPQAGVVHLTTSVSGGVFEMLIATKSPLNPSIATRSGVGYNKYSQTGLSGIVHGNLRIGRRDETP